jgi:predicted NACHT family NTPase
MTDVYVERELIVDQNGAAKLVVESDIFALGFPLVVLGDPGVGKTKLTERLAASLRARRISAGSFVRNANLEALKPPAGLPIIVDGLDELTASSGASAVDEVLKKLSLLGYPPFILSCRATDWNGSADRQKIREDYGVEPTTATLKPFSRSDATRFLSSRECIDTEHLLEELDRRDLSEFYRNPLALKLIAEIAADNQGLPTGRADLFDRASRLLLLPTRRRRHGEPRDRA